MPMYEYECQKCHHRVELIQKYSDAPLAECPKCQGAVKKIITAPALQFKGSGWYITDYSGKGKDKGTDHPADQKAPETTPSESKPSTETAAPTTTAAEKKSDEGKKANGKKRSEGEKKSDGGGTSSTSPSKSDKSEGTGKP